MNTKKLIILLNEVAELLNESSAKQRILALRLLEKQKKYPELAKELGINVKIKEKNKSNDSEKDGKKKTQNESIAILLTEAALLLNEGAKQREEIKDSSGKSSKDYGHMASKNLAKANAICKSDVEGPLGHFERLRSAMAQVDEFNENRKKGKLAKLAIEEKINK